LLEVPVMQELAIMHRLTAAVLYIDLLLFPPVPLTNQITRSMAIAPHEQSCVARFYLQAASDSNLAALSAACNLGKWKPRLVR
jgi:hypothetical protein